MKLLIKSILFFFLLSLQKPVCILCLNHISSHTNPISRAQYSHVAGGCHIYSGAGELGLTQCLGSGPAGRYVTAVFE